ncbi:tetratricopeptide repeat protein, partial [Cooperia oncophora]
LFQRSEEWRTELDLYASGLRVCTQNAKVHYNLGKVLSRIGDVDGAEHNYWNAIRKRVKTHPWIYLKLRPPVQTVSLNLGMLYESEIKDPSMTLRKRGRKATNKLDPHHSKALTNIFVALDEREECDAVVTMAERIPNTVVDQSAALAFQIGVCLGKIARFAEAERVLYQRWARYDLAENSYIQALLIDSETQSIKWNLRAVQEKLNRTRQSDRANTYFYSLKMVTIKEALNSFHRSIQLRPSSADCLFNLGNLYQKMKRPERALEAWKNATMLDPHHSKALTNIFVALDEREECDAVVTMAERIPNTVVDQSAALAFQIGVCLGKIARFAEAERHLKIAIELSPQNA